MFQKPAFGSNATSGFGTFNTSATTATPFGGFKPTTSTFGAATATQPTTGGGLFSSNTSGGLFGNTAATPSTSSFGTNSTGFGFGAAPATGGLFGNTTSSGLFGNTQNNSAFGAKPAGFGFGGTAPAGTPTGGLFGAAPAAGTGLFGQQNTSIGGGLFGSTTTGAFGQQQQQQTGTGHTKYNPVGGTDVVVKSGTSQNISIKHHCITCMKEYENKSLEELRLEDYTAGRKGSTNAGVFGFQQPAENKPLFGATGFGQPATTSAPSMFGGGGLGTTTGFGQTSNFSFGNAAQNTTNTSGLFGANKPTFGATPTTGTGLFGAATTQAPTFGTTTPSFGFGSNTQAQTGGLFGAKPAGGAFGAATAGGSAFGGGLFGASTTAPSTTPAFGNLSGGFGTSTSTTGGLFANNSTFGKPTATQPTFGFNTQPIGASGVGGAGVGGGLGGAFQTKGAAPAFGQLGAPGLFQAPPAATAFKTGLDSGLGGGLFSNTSALGGSAFGLGAMNTNTSMMANNSLSGASAAGNVHEQMLTLAARPYGDSPLFKDLLPDASAEDVLKPTNPAAMRAVLDRTQNNSYRVTSPNGGRLRPQPRAALTHDKKSLFDGLEESDASLEDKLCLKPSRKRLVLRSSTNNDSRSDVEQLTNNTNRSAEESLAPREASPLTAPTSHPVHAPAPSPGPPSHHTDTRRAKLSDSGNLELSSDRHGSWLNSPKPMWSDKEKPIDGEPTPRLYPNLDKELPNQGSERRASWLTTKPLRKPLSSGNPDAVENSVRELGVRHEDLSHDKENVETLSVSEEEHVATRDAPPHPTGVKLTRPGYYTIPSLDDMINYMRSDGTCVVPHLTIGRKNYGNVYYDCEIDVAGLDLDALVYFLNKEVIVYPEDAVKPPVGEGLNRRAIVTLDRIWPRDKTEKRPITDPDRLLKMDYEGKLRRVCDKHDTKFIEYRPQTGSWVFRVEHFSKYGLTDSDEEDDPTPDVLKRQLVNQALQKSSALVPKPPVPVSAAGASVLPPGSLLAAEDSVFTRHAPLAALSGVAKGFEMDTTEDNNESESLYQDNRAYGVKSPTSELARLEHRQSHNVQLMKASLYAEAEMEEDMSVSTGDQLVPLSAPLVTMSARSASPLRDSLLPVENDTPLVTDELTMKPLVVHPHTIVLKYHRKVPPFKNTIAGRLGAAYIADMSVCRARHTRTGFGPAGALAYVTTYDSVCDLPKSAELCDLGKYVRGRMSDDWSESVVTRLAIGQADNSYNIETILAPHLATLLEYSTVLPAPATCCPRRALPVEPRDRLAVLRQHLEHSRTRRHDRNPRFGVSGAYCHEVWKLCDALWAADLENDGVPATDELSIVRRHQRLLEWFAAAVSTSTDLDLSHPRRGETEDEADGHSAQVWTLLLGGRVVEACKLSRHHGDLNMAMLIAQAAGDPIFRSLIARQLSLWRECGADSLVSSHRRATLQLAAGSAPLLEMAQVDWLRALHATARYLCPQVPTLEQIIRTYEGFFTTGGDEPDLLILPEDEVTMRLPLPPYETQYKLTGRDEKHRNVFDIRYELLRARAFNCRPKLQPAAYSPDPFDYSLCFLLGTWFGNPSTESITGTAHQLEAAGAWHAALHVLTYHPDDIARGHLIRGVLSRHAPAKADTPELKSRLELVTRLGVPHQWLRLAQAHRAKYEGLPAIEAEHLIGAGQWNAAHKVLLEELLPEAVLADDLQSISPLVGALQAAAQAHEVAGWEAGGQALHHYLRVCDEIRGLVSSAEEQTDRAEVQARLEALRPRVAAACRALGGLRPTSARHAAARAEMGARLLQLALAAGERAPHLAVLLRALALPPDCTAHAQLKITTDLAEQASELCIESASSSPLSSHHRATLAS